jgi:hypothetical protein
LVDPLFQPPPRSVVIEGAADGGGCEVGITLVAGVVETADQEDRAYNTLVAFGLDGNRLAFYVPAAAAGV